MIKNSYSIENKCILICGGLGWLGYHYSKSIIESGASLIILDNGHIDDYQFSKEELKKVKFYSVNFYNHKLFNSKLNEIFKNNKIDCLINNAFDFSKNTGFDEKRSLLDSDIDQWIKTADSGLIWPLLSTRNFLQERKDNSLIKIINIASMYGIVAPNPENYNDTSAFMLPQYGMVKASIINFTKYLASYYGESGVISNCIAPGAFPKEENLTKTFREKLISNIPLSRLGQPDDLVGVMLFLISDDSNYITGQTVVVDGGWIIR